MKARTPSFPGQQNHRIIYYRCCRLSECCGAIDIECVCVHFRVQSYENISLSFWTIQVFSQVATPRRPASSTPTPLRRSASRGPCAADSHPDARRAHRFLRRRGVPTGDRRGTSRGGARARCRVPDSSLRQPPRRPPLSPVLTCPIIASSQTTRLHLPHRPRKRCPHPPN